MKTLPTLFKFDLHLYERARSRYINQTAEVKVEEADYTYEALLQAISRHMYEQKENRARTDIESAVARLNKGGPDVFAAPASEKLPKKQKEKKSKKEKKQERAAAKSAAQAAAPAEVAEPIKWCWFYNNCLITFKFPPIN